MGDTFDFPEEWLHRGFNPKKLDKYTVDHDRWDDKDIRDMLKEVAPFSAARKTLGEFVDTGEPAMVDMFLSLLKAEPTLLEPAQIRPDHLVNRFVQEQATELDEFERLRRYSVNDDVQAALSASTLEPDLETLFDRMEKQREQAQQLQQKMQQLAQALQEERDLDELVKEWAEENDVPDCETCEGSGEVPADEPGEQGEGEGEGEGEGQGQGQGTQPCPDCSGTGHDPNGQPGGNGNPSGQKGKETRDPEQIASDLEEFAKRMQEARDKVEQAQREAQAAQEALDNSLEKAAGSVRHSLRDMLNRAADEAQASNDLASTWGLEPGELQKMDAKERMDLAKRLNNDRFRRIADLFGPMKNLMLSEQARKTVASKEEIYDVEMGSDLSRILPTEIMNLRMGVTRLDFLRRYSEGKLMQYAMQGHEKLARGGMIMCEDGSGSMSGDRELWAKAVMLCLLHLSRIQKRTFHLIHFGSPGQFKIISFEKPEDYTLDRILDAAELFFSGGTDFQTPMKEAQKLLVDEFTRTGSIRSDVVFVTDDECWVDDAYMEEYLDNMHKMSGTTWGISVSGADRRDGALMRMTESKVAVIKDFLSGGDIRGIFRGL